ncbi:unnamed protein product, partial [Musa textilis]
AAIVSLRGQGGTVFPVSAMSGRTSNVLHGNIRDLLKQNIKRRWVLLHASAFDLRGIYNPRRFLPTEKESGNRKFF